MQTNLANRQSHHVLATGCRKQDPKCTIKKIGQEEKKKLFCSIHICHHTTPFTPFHHSPWYSLTQPTTLGKHTFSLLSPNQNTAFLRPDATIPQEEHKYPEDRTFDFREFNLSSSTFINRSRRARKSISPPLPHPHAGLNPQGSPGQPANQHSPTTQPITTHHSKCTTIVESRAMALATRRQQTSEERLQPQTSHTTRRAGQRP